MKLAEKTRYQDYRTQFDPHEETSQLARMQASRSLADCAGMKQQAGLINR